MGWREAKRRLTVVSNVSGQVSAAPSTVPFQWNARVRSAMSPLPMIGDERLDDALELLRLELNEGSFKSRAIKG
jgi:hypothetical protein